MLKKNKIFLSYIIHALVNFYENTCIHLVSPCSSAGSPPRRLCLFFGRYFHLMAPGYIPGIQPRLCLHQVDVRELGI